MKTLFVISPWYLSQIFEEAKDFSFLIQGYGSIRDAMNGILRVNSADLLGIAFVHDDIPAPETKEFSRLRLFLERVNRLDPKKVVFVLRNSSTGIRQLVNGLNNIKVFVSSEHSTLTDTVIRQNVFGSLLLDNTPVYDLRRASDNKQNLGDPLSYQLKYEEFIGHSYLNVLNEINRYGNLPDTVQNDEVYQEFQSTNQLLALLRRKVITNSFDTTDKALDTMLDKMIDDIDDSEIWCLCNVLKEVKC